MRIKKVEEIVLPYKEGIPLCPSVKTSDKIIHAIEVMVSNDLKDIAVVQNKQPIAMVRLEDALKKLGLKIPQEE